MVKSSLASAQVVQLKEYRNTQEEGAKSTAQKEHIVLLQMLLWASNSLNPDRNALRICRA